jgi:hypothetical protein
MIDRTLADLPGIVATKRVRKRLPNGSPRIGKGTGFLKVLRI